MLKRLELLEGPALYCCRRLSPKGLAYPLPAPDAPSRGDLGGQRPFGLDGSRQADGRGSGTSAGLVGYQWGRARSCALVHRAPCGRRFFRDERPFHVARIRFRAVDRVFERCSAIWCEDLGVSRSPCDQVTLRVTLDSPFVEARDTPARSCSRDRSVPVRADGRRFGAVTGFECPTDFCEAVARLAERAEKASEGRELLSCVVGRSVRLLWHRLRLKIRPLFQTPQRNDSKLRYDARHVAPSFTA